MRTLNQKKTAVADVAKQPNDSSNFPIDDSHALTTELAAARSEIKSLGQQLESQQASKASFENRDRQLNRATAELAALQNKFNVASQTINNLESTVAEHTQRQEDQQNLQTQLQETQSVIDAAVQREQELEAVVRDLKQAGETSRRSLLDAQRQDETLDLQKQTPETSQRRLADRPLAHGQPDESAESRIRLLEQQLADQKTLNQTVGQQADIDQSLRNNDEAIRQLRAEIQDQNQRLTQQANEHRQALTQVLERATKKSMSGRTKKSSDPNDLGQITGIGPVAKKRLIAAGVTGIDQLAAWTDADVTEFSNKLGFKDQIKRQEWVRQAVELLTQR